MNIESKVLQVEDLSRIPFNDLLSLFRQEYKFAEQGENAIELGLNIGLNILDIKGNDIRSLATCPSTVTTGRVLTLSTSMSSGTAPYTYRWTVTKPDGTTETLANQASNQYTLTANGNYTISVYATDSCASGVKTSNTESCMITASPVVGTKYNCVSNQCVGPFVTGTYDNLAACQASGCLGGGGVGCLNCDLTKNYCLAGNCVPKKYVLFAGVGLVALIVLKSK